MQPAPPMLLIDGLPCMRMLQDPIDGVAKFVYQLGAKTGSLRLVIVERALKFVLGLFDDDRDHARALFLSRPTTSSTGLAVVLPA